MRYSFSQMSRKEFRHALVRAEPALFEELIRFLEDDPISFGTGYEKEIVWKYIKRYELEPSHIARLERAALQYLFRPMTREFKPMCLTMARIATDDFWKSVRSFLESEIPRARINASCLYPYSEGVTAGEKQRLQRRRSYPRRYNYDDVDRVKKLLALVKAPHNWPDGKVITREPNPTDLPILYYSPEYDHYFATLDVASGHTEKLLKQLESALSTGYNNLHTAEVWLYTIYLLRQINNPGAVPILIQFMHTMVDPLVEGPRQRMLESTTLKVLRYYHTPEALAVIEEHKEADRKYSDQYDELGQGWILSYPQSDN